MEWVVRLQGNNSDLQELSKSLNSAELCITEENDKFLLKSSSFNQLDDANEVKEKAEELLPLICGAARAAFRMRRQLVVDAVIKINDDGTREPINFLSDTVYPSSSTNLTITRNNGTVEEIHQADPIPGWINIAQNDDNVAKVLRLMGKGAIDWVGLYRIYDVIEHDVGGIPNIVSNGWTSRNQIERFRHTANSVGAIGDLARHGVERTMPPPNPMSFSEAESFINTIIHNWLQTKV
jgi:hypothetical protein